MSSEKIPLLPFQLVLIAAVIALPFAGSAIVVHLFSRAGASSGSDTALVHVLAILSVLVPAFLMLAIVSRRTVTFTPDGLTIRHGFYTVQLTAGAQRIARVEVVDSPDRIRIQLKSNGIAAFGLYSGWFIAASAPCFCAISSSPICVLQVEGHPRCRMIAFSCTPAMVERVRKWQVALSA
ncbi:hypothetical protein QPK32_07530 [Massilia sp. YIM B02763]|uniref:hypothetical protein n=1 Tax=Massilia sp. YIM B02763 TaxID=3050130 RepID=UPI0025B65720|nr:hypothetical protein [Massilia sp. YIM B02763]MDN4052924.1 hypothetical protein [Massilia sp. YIM B02763]